MNVNIQTNAKLPAVLAPPKVLTKNTFLSVRDTEQVPIVSIPCAFRWKLCDTPECRESVFPACGPLDSLGWYGLSSHCA